MWLAIPTLPLDPGSSLDFDTLQPEVIAACDNDLLLPTCRANEVPAVQGEPVIAGQAAQGCVDALEVELGALCDCVFADDIPVELDRLIYDGGEFANDHIESRNPLRTGFFRVAERDLH
jgi:hypothetical protein